MAGCEGINMARARDAGAAGARPDTKPLGNPRTLSTTRAGRDAEGGRPGSVIGSGC